MIVDIQTILKEKQNKIDEADKARIVLIDMQDRLMTLDIKKHELNILKDVLLNEIIRLSRIVAGEKE